MTNDPRANRCDQHVGQPAPNRPQERCNKPAELSHETPSGHRYYLCPEHGGPSPQPEPEFRCVCSSEGVDACIRQAEYAQADADAVPSETDLR